jgi:hypothetical protein
LPIIYDILGLKKGFEMSKIIIGFSGWVEADPESIRFQYIGEMAAAEALISGTDYLKLDEDERYEYILEDLGQAYTNAFDGELDVCDVSVEEDPDHVAKEFLEDLLKDKI